MRSASNDFLQGFRYHVIADNGSGQDPLQPRTSRKDHGESAHAGFQSVTSPEISVEAVEYREGISKFAEKYPGPPVVTQMTLIRGITKADTAFYDMVMASIEGLEYRCDVTIYHYQRTEHEDAVKGEPLDSARRIECINCFASRAKPSGDLDSMAGDVSLSEVDLELESFKLFTPQKVKTSDAIKAATAAAS